MGEEPRDSAPTLAESPEGSCSSADEVGQWVRELEGMPPVPSVTKALAQARKWLSESQKQK
jgi:hypothetical protein